MKKKVLLIIALIIIVLIVIVGIIYYSINLTLKIGTEKLKLNISMSEDKIFDLTSFSSEKVDIKKYGFSKVKINDIEINNKYSLENFEINKENLIKIDVSYLFGKVNKTYFINTLPEDFPKYKVSGESK